MGRRLTGDIDLTAEAGDLSGAFTVHVGERAGFCLAYTPTYEDDDGHVTAPEDGLRDTLTGWQSWAADHRGYQGRHLPAVRRSALVLQGLTYQKTGAVAAAATTSLPEQLGGELNWDYRFAWLRDVSLTLQALWVAACPDEADRFFTWLAAAGGLLDHYLGRTGYSSQQTDEPADPDAPNYLFSAVPGDHGTHGPFDDQSHGRSVQLPLSLHRRSLAVGLGIAGAAVALASRR